MDAGGGRVRRDAISNLIGRRGAGPVLASARTSTGARRGPLRPPARRAASRSSAGGARPPFDSRWSVRRRGGRALRHRLPRLEAAGRALRPGLARAARPSDGRHARRPRPRSRAAARAAPRLLAYFEVHIEQGPVLERGGVPVGIVTAITGQSRAEVASPRGRPRGHRPDGAAATRSPPPPSRPRPPRRRGGDGRPARGRPGRATSSRARRMTLDLRHGDDTVRRAAVERPARRGEGGSRGDAGSSSTGSGRRRAAVADAERADRRGARRATPAACQRRGPRRRGDGRDRPGRDAVRALRAADQPQPRRAVTRPTSRSRSTCSSASCDCRRPAVHGGTVVLPGVFAGHGRRRGRRTARSSRSAPTWRPRARSSTPAGCTCSPA